jgi:hypothetical protein
VSAYLNERYATHTGEATYDPKHNGRALDGSPRSDLVTGTCELDEF